MQGILCFSLVGYHKCTYIYAHCMSASAQVSLLVGQSILLGYLTDYFVVDSPNATDTRNAYLYATGVLIAPLVLIHCGTYHLYNAAMSGMTVRLIASSAIYKKVMM